MEVRTEQGRDHDAVRAIHRRAFGDQGATVAALVDGVRGDDPAALSLVAEEAGDVVGHVMFSRSLLDAPRRLVAVQVLSPLAVAADRQRQGIGRALIRHGVRLLDLRKVPLVFVEGNPRYYRGAGFVPGRQLGFRRPSLRIPDEAFQVRPLSGYEPWMVGTLVYPAIFWDHDCVGLRDDGG